MSTTKVPTRLSLLAKPARPVTPRRVLVLSGGWSSERFVSLRSGTAVVNALTSLGHRVASLDPSRSGLLMMVQQIKNTFEGDGPEVIFNALFGSNGEDGTIQGVLNLLDIPYTFSGVLGSALATNKAVSRDLVSAHGVLCPPGQVVPAADYLELIDYFPHVVKPLDGGSSIGVRFVADTGDQSKVLDTVIQGAQLLVEKYVPGRELTVTVLGGVAVGVLEIVFKEPIYTKDEKYESADPLFLIPAPLHPDAYKQALESAEKAHKVLRCRAVSRSDFRYECAGGEPGTLYYLETNAQPGFSPISLAPRTVLGATDWTYEDLVQWVVEDAACPK